MSWTDEELDDLFRDSAEKLSFDYKKEYWKDIEAQLPVKKKRDFLWNGMALMFLIGVGSMMLRNTISDLDRSSQSSVIAQYNNEKLNDNNAEVKTGQDVALWDCVDLSNLDFIWTNNQINTSDWMVGGCEIHPFNNIPNNYVMPVFDEGASVDNTIVELKTKKAETIIQSDNSTIEQIPSRIDYTPFHDFYVQGIAGIGQGRMVPGEGMSSSYGLGAGVEFNRRKLYVSLAINGIISNHQSLVLTRSSKVYGFGSEEYSTSVEISRLYTLESEIAAGYRFGKTVVYGGLNAGYLIGTQSNVTTEQKDVALDVVDSDTRKVYGYFGGLNRLSLKPMIGASYDAGRRIQVGANVGVQMLNSVDPEYFEGESRKFPVDGRIYLRMKL